MSKPPPLPADVLARVVRIARIDGRVLVLLAGGFGVISALWADWLGAAVGGLAAGAGAIELYGRRRLLAGDGAGVRWLVRSQIILLGVILAYVVYQYFCYDPLPMLATFEQKLEEAQQARGMETVTVAELLGFRTQKEFAMLVRSAVRGSYAVVGVASVLCQGGLAYYYHRKNECITRWLRKS